jgi:hypothetical protein
VAGDGEFALPAREDVPWLQPFFRVEQNSIAEIAAYGTTNAGRYSLPRTI